MQPLELKPPPQPGCLKCDTPLPDGYPAACGIKAPCPTCGHPYPLGDCSD